MSRQKNWTHVRQLLGYQRLERPELVSLYQRALSHLGPPAQLLLPKPQALEQDAQRSHDRSANTARLKPPTSASMESKHLNQEQKQKLQNQFQQLNPLQLKRKIEQQLKSVCDKIKPGNAHCASTTCSSLSRLRKR